MDENNWQLLSVIAYLNFFRDNKINHPESNSVVMLESYYRYLKIKPIDLMN
jgi:hypothetical protein